MADFETDTEREAVRRVAWMCEQYLEENGEMDHLCMSAGERALELLLSYDSVDSRGRRASWTEKGRDFLEGRWPILHD